MRLVANMPTSALTDEEMLKFSDVSVVHDGSTIVYVTHTIVYVYMILLNGFNGTVREGGTLRDD